MLPFIDGFTILKKLRSENIPSKIIMLTAKSMLEDKLNGLENEANDYLTKPFHMDELIARINIQLNNNHPHILNDTLEFGDLILNRKKSQVTCKHNNQVIELVCKEYQLLEYFFNNPEQILNKEQIYNKVWGFDNKAESNILEAYLSFIRRKLKAIDSNVKIKSIRNLGYKMELS